MEEKEDPFYCGEEEPSVAEENFNNRIAKRRMLMPIKKKQITDEELVSTWQSCVSLLDFKSRMDLSWDALGDMLNRVQELRKHGVRLKTMNVFTMEFSRFIPPEWRK